MIPPPCWSREQLEAHRRRAIEVFRRERLDEPVEAYAKAFDENRRRVEDLLSATVDLQQILDGAIKDVLGDKAKLDAFRYLAGPPISEDDLRVLAEANSLAPTRLRSSLEDRKRIAEVVVACLDRRRFPWVQEGRPPTDSERAAAVLASACLMAYQRIQTWRRNEGKARQEKHVRDALLGLGFRKELPRPMGTVGNAPGPGAFCDESMVGTRKADFVVGLWDERKMLIECKVSNSELNSVKRLNNDAAAKAEAWLQDFGRSNVVPTAVLSGVFKLHNLVEAQDRGLVLFWAHDLDAFAQWVSSTRRDA